MIRSDDLYRGGEISSRRYAVDHVLCYNLGKTALMLERSDAASRSHIPRGVDERGLWLPTCAVSVILMAPLTKIAALIR